MRQSSVCYLVPHNKVTKWSIWVLMDRQLASAVTRYRPRGGWMVFQWLKVGGWGWGGMGFDLYRSAECCNAFTSPLPVPSKPKIEIHACAWPSRAILEVKISWQIPQLCYIDLIRSIKTVILLNKPNLNYITLIIFLAPGFNIKVVLRLHWLCSSTKSNWVSVSCWKPTFLSLTSA